MEFRTPSRWSLVALLAFGAPILAIAFVQYRWLLELRNRSEVIATQQNHEAALWARDLMENELSAARVQVLPPVGHADLLSLDLGPIANVFQKGQERFGYVDRFFVWAESMPRGEALFYDPDLHRFAPDPERLACMPEAVWGWNPVEHSKGRWAEFRGLGEPPACQVVIHLILDDDEQNLIGLAGFVVDLRQFVHEFAPRFAAESLTPAVRELVGAENTVVGLLDERGKPMGHGKQELSFASSSVELPVSFTLASERNRMMTPMRWRLSVGEPSSDRVATILRRGAMGNLAIVGIGMIALALGGVLVARSSAREAKLSDLKSRFISGVSHDLKTPLSMIRLYSEMLELGRVPRGKERKLFQSLHQQAELMYNMLEEILDFSRLEAEQSSARVEPCSIEEIVDEAVEMRDWQSHTPHSVQVDLGPGLPTVQCNRSAMVRVLYNLLDNASKYSGLDEPITLGVRRVDGMVAIEVADRGVGIAPEDMPHLFERFYRGQTAGSVKGTGLGLSIVHSVVSSHGGRVEVASEPGGGARFTVLLPLRGGG